MALVLGEGKQAIPIQCDRHYDGNVQGVEGEPKKDTKISMGLEVGVGGLHFLQEVTAKFGLKYDKEYDRQRQMLRRQMVAGVCSPKE